jgi:hypothetical protein
MLKETASPGVPLRRIDWLENATLGVRVEELDP